MSCIEGAPISFVRCFSAVPLSQEVRELYQAFHGSLLARDSRLYYSDPRTRHVTTNLLKDLSGDDALKILPVIRVVQEELRGVRIRIGGYGHIIDKNGYVSKVYARVHEAQELIEASRYLQSELGSFMNMNVHWDYNPHVLIAGVPQRRRSESRSKMMDETFGLLIDDLDWSMRIEEVNLFGSLSRVKQQGLIRLDELLST